MNPWNQVLAENNPPFMRKIFEDQGHSGLCARTPGPCSCDFVAREQRRLGTVNRVTREEIAALELSVAENDKARGYVGVTPEGYGIKAAVRSNPLHHDDCPSVHYDFETEKDREAACECVHLEAMQMAKPKTAKPWMQYGTTTYTIGSENPGGITVQDVAMALSRINRFTGHGTRYSVAKHSVFVSELLDLSTEAALYGLIHDAHETVINDIAWPVKQALGPQARAEFDAIEEAADKALYKVFDMPWPMPAEIKALVKKADWIAVATEKRDLLPECGRKWDMLAEPPHHRHVSRSTSCSEDAHDFISRFERLKGIA